MWAQWRKGRYFKGQTGRYFRFERKRDPDDDAAMVSVRSHHQRSSCSHPDRSRQRDHAPQRSESGKDPSEAEVPDLGWVHILAEQGTGPHKK